MEQITEQDIKDLKVLAGSRGWQLLVGLLTERHNSLFEAMMETQKTGEVVGMRDKISEIRNIVAMPGDIINSFEGAAQ